jgi:hypothetical protein
VTQAYDPTMGGDQTADLGHATNSVLVTGYRLPADVPPVQGEFSRSYDSGCGTRTHNPRDGLGAVIVAVPGEEGFVDLNGNGVYDAGEPFVDTGEPFVDEDDNGVRESDEPFIDVNQSGAWDGPNGTWDSNTVIWAEARVLYSGGLGADARWLAREDQPLLPAETPPVMYEVGFGTSQTFGVYLADARLNPPSNAFEYTITPSAGDPVAIFGVSPSVTDTIGVSLTQQFCDKPAPAGNATCSSTCKTSPCYRRAMLSNFQYGRNATGIISAGAAFGLGAVRVAAALGDETSSITITGETK